MKSKVEILVTKWMAWNQRKISAETFCLEFQKQYQNEIDKALRKYYLKHRILEEMVIEELSKLL